LAEKIAAILGGDLGMGQITRNELRRAKQPRPTDLQAYDHFLLGQEGKTHPSKEGIARGFEHLNKAIALDPELARAYSVRAWLHYFRMMFDGADPAEMIANMAADAGRPSNSTRRTGRH
jgi:hypothetical protein